MNELTFLFDLDGTLKTPADSDGPWEMKHTSIKFGNNSWNMVMRPYTKEVLESAKKKGKVFLSTAAGREYAEKVLKEFGIAHYFDKLITIEDFMMGIEYFPNFVMIDDDEDMAPLKIERMAKGSLTPIRQDLWLIDAFKGNSDDKVLLAVKNKIENI